MTVVTRGKKWAVQVYDAKAPGRRRWLGTFETEREAVDAERAARLGIAPSGRARTIRDWSMVWLRDYPRPAIASRRTYRYAVEQIHEEAGDLLLEGSIARPLGGSRSAGRTGRHAWRGRCSPTRCAMV